MYGINRGFGYCIYCMNKDTKCCDRCYRGSHYESNELYDIETEE